MDSSLSYEKVWFALSLMALSFLYGVGVGTWKLFPHSYMDRAVAQARMFLDTGLDSKPAAFDHQGARVHRGEEIAPGMTTVASWWKTSDGLKIGMKLIDRKGNALHEWLVERDIFESAGLQKGSGDTGVHGSLLLPNGDVVFNQFYVGTVRLNSCGEVQWTLTEGSHHSVAQAEDGTFWITAVSQKKRNGSAEYPEGFPGLEAVWVDRILHVSENGEILADINVLDILYKNDLERFLFEVPRQTSVDITHQNDVEPLSPSLAEEYPLFDAGDLVVSLKHINLIFVFDPITKEVKWHSQGPFIGQHDPDFIGNGWIGVFDNNSVRGKAMDTGSRIIAFQPHTDSTRILFQPDQIDRFYTRTRGNWQHLENGNMLLTESEVGRAIEVNHEGSLLWEWIHEPTDDGQAPYVTNATRHDLTREEVASWPCSSVDSVNTSNQNE